MKNLNYFLELPVVTWGLLLIVVLIAVLLFYIPYRLSKAESTISPINSNHPHANRPKDFIRGYNCAIKAIEAGECPVALKDEGEALSNDILDDWDRGWRTACVEEIVKRKSK